MKRVFPDCLLHIFREAQKLEERMKNVLPMQA
jgi:hypothetical protein